MQFKCRFLVAADDSRNDWLIEGGHEQGDWRAMSPPSAIPFIPALDSDRIVRSWLPPHETRIIESSETGLALLVLAGAVLVDDGSSSWVAPAEHVLTVTPCRSLRITPYRGCHVGVARLDVPIGSDCQLFRISPLLTALALHNDPGTDGHVGHALFLQEMQRAQLANYSVRMPRDPRARRVAQAIVDDPADPRSLEIFADQSSASRRTLLRLFVAQTGLSFRQFRRQVRIYRSLAMLAGGTAIQDAALAVGYESTSAFIGAFRMVMGRTPGSHLKELGLKTII